MGSHDLPGLMDVVGFRGFQWLKLSSERGRCRQNDEARRPALERTHAPDSEAEIPTRLLEPPAGPPGCLPALHRERNLPFGRLPWSDFEKLVYGIAQLEEGDSSVLPTDDLARLSEGRYVCTWQSGQYHCWEAKQYRSLTRADIRAAVQTFLEGK